MDEEVKRMQSGNHEELAKENKMLLEVIENLNKVVTGSFKKIQKQEQQISELKKDQDDLLLEIENWMYENGMLQIKLKELVAEIEILQNEKLNEEKKEESHRSNEDMTDNAIDEDESNEENKDDSDSDDESEDNGENTEGDSEQSDANGKDEEDYEERTESEAANTVKEVKSMQSENYEELEKENKLLLKVIENNNIVLTESFKKIQKQEEQISDLEKNLDRLVMEANYLMDENCRLDTKIYKLERDLEVVSNEKLLNEEKKEENLGSIEDLDKNATDEDESNEENEDDSDSDDESGDNGDNVEGESEQSEANGTDEEEHEEHTESEAKITVPKKKSRNIVMQFVLEFVAVFLTLVYGYGAIYFYLTFDS